MDIGEVVHQSGVAASALRYYESRGLIISRGRAGARRQFGPEVLERLALIALGRSAGLSLDEIGAMLPLDGALRVDRNVLRRRVDALDEQIRRLRVMRDGLSHAAECKAADHLSCPTFRKLLGKAIRGRTGRGG